MYELKRDIAVVALHLLVEVQLVSNDERVGLSRHDPSTVRKLLRK